MFFSTSQSLKEVGQAVSFRLNKKQNNQKLSQSNQIKVYSLDCYNDNVSNTNEHVGITTPKREVLLLSPSALVQVGASPSSSRYSSIRKLEFGSSEKKRSLDSIRKLNFFKFKLSCFSCSFFLAYSDIFDSLRLNFNNFIFKKDGCCLSAKYSKNI